MRGLAVIAVVAYHLWPSALPGGFIGVEVFFVLSGYLITRSFRARPGENVGARLRRFWRHRARRILPPLLPVVIITAIAAALVGRNVLPGLWSAVLGAVTFSSNWVAIIEASSYFAGTRAHPLQHLWSLAVEEQFYLLWPLLLLGISLTPRRARHWFPIGVAVLSALAMAVLYVPGTDPTFVYVGTGTHVFGLALGAAFALADDRDQRRTTPILRDRLLAVTAGFGSLSVLVVAAVILQDTDPGTYRGGLVLVSVATVALIWSLTRGVPGIGRLLDVTPLRSLGRRSYAVYLWHWPLLVLLTAAITPRSGSARIGVWTVTILLTLIAAYVSWRWVEQPVLTGGWHAVLNHARTWRPPARAAALLTTAMLIVGTGAACAASTRPSDAEQLITAGQQYLHDHSTAPAPQPSTQAPSTPPQTAPPQTAPQGVPTSSTQQTQPPTPSTPVPTAVPEVTQTRITAVGDSVMLAAAPTLKAMLPNVAINAEVSRQPYQVAGILRAAAAAGQLADTVLVGIGTNGALGSALPQIRAAIGPNRTLVLITAHGDRSWIPGVNQAILAYAATAAHTRVAQWDTAITGDEDLLAADGIHPGSAGSRVYAQAIINALQ